MSSRVLGYWRDEMRGLTHHIAGSANEVAEFPDDICWSSMTKCRHVRTVPARDIDDRPVPVTCLWCAR